MAKFYGVIGYGQSIEISPGVWEDVIIERKSYGDVLRNTQQLENGENVNNNLNINNSFSVMADAYANDHIIGMLYIKWMGVYWNISSIDVQPPRLILRVGGVYNGQKAATPSTA